jgi:hypothetical protein
MLFECVRTTVELSVGQYIWHSVLQDKALDNEQHTRHQLLCAGYGEALTRILQGTHTIVYTLYQFTAAMHAR